MDPPRHGIIKLKCMKAEVEFDGHKRVRVGSRECPESQDIRMDVSYWSEIEEFGDLYLFIIHVHSLQESPQFDGQTIRDFDCLILKRGKPPVKTLAKTAINKATSKPSKIAKVFNIKRNEPHSDPRPTTDEKYNSRIGACRYSIVSEERIREGLVNYFLTPDTTLFLDQF